MKAQRKRMELSHPHPKARELNTTKRPESLSLSLPHIHILLRLLSTGSYMDRTATPARLGQVDLLSERLDVTEETHTDNLRSRWRRDYVSVFDSLLISLKAVGHQAILPPRH